MVLVVVLLFLALTAWGYKLWFSGGVYPSKHFNQAMKENKEDNYGNKPDPTAKRDQGLHPNQEGRNETGRPDPKTGHGNETTGYTGERVTDYEDDASETRFKGEGIEYVDSKVRSEEPASGIQKSINPESESLGEATGNNTADGLEQK